MSTTQHSEETLVPDEPGPGSNVVDDFQVSVIQESTSLLVTVTTPAFPSIVHNKTGRPFKRAPINLCVVVDVSQSMSSSYDPSKSVEKGGVMLVEIAKQALRTIVHTLDEGAFYLGYAISQSHLI